MRPWEEVIDRDALLQAAYEVSRVKQALQEKRARADLKNAEEAKQWVSWVQADNFNPTGFTAQLIEVAGREYSSDEWDEADHLFLILNTLKNAATFEAAKLLRNYLIAHSHLTRHHCFNLLLLKHPEFKIFANFNALFLHIISTAILFGDWGALSLEDSALVEKFKSARLRKQIKKSVPVTETNKTLFSLFNSHEQNKSDEISAILEKNPAILLKRNTKCESIIQLLIREGKYKELQILLAQVKKIIIAGEDKSNEIKKHCLRVFLDCDTQKNNAALGVFKSLDFDQLNEAPQLNPQDNFVKAINSFLKEQESIKNKRRHFRDQQKPLILLRKKELKQVIAQLKNPPPPSNRSILSQYFSFIQAPEQPGERNVINTIRCLRTIGFPIDESSREYLIARFTEITAYFEVEIQKLDRLEPIAHTYNATSFLVETDLPTVHQNNRKMVGIPFCINGDTDGDTDGDMLKPLL